MSDPLPSSTEYPADSTATAGIGLAPHHLRLFSLIVDYLLVVVTLNMVQKVLLGADWDLHPLGPWRAMLPLGAVLVVLKDTLGGISPGRWLTGIAVVRADDPSSAPGWSRLALRNLFLLLLPVEVVLVFLDPYFRRWGDRVAGTVVVVPAHTAPYFRRLLGLTILFFISTLAIFGLEYWNVHRSAAYHTALEAALRHPRLIEAVGGKPEVAEEPGLGLSEDAEGRKAVVAFKAKGPKGTVKVEVILRLDAANRRWRLELLNLKGKPEK